MIVNDFSMIKCRITKGGEQDSGHQNLTGRRRHRLRAPDREEDQELQKENLSGSSAREHLGADRLKEE